MGSDVKKRWTVRCDPETVRKVNILKAHYGLDSGGVIDRLVSLAHEDMNSKREIPIGEAFLDSEEVF